MRKGTFCSLFYNVVPVRAYQMAINCWTLFSSLGNDDFFCFGILGSIQYWLISWILMDDHHCIFSKKIVFWSTCSMFWPKILSEQALIRARRVDKSLKMIKRTCSSIRNLRVRTILKEQFTNFPPTRSYFVWSQKFFFLLKVKLKFATAWKMARTSPHVLICSSIPLNCELTCVVRTFLHLFISSVVDSLRKPLAIKISSVVDWRRIWLAGKLEKCWIRFWK